MSDRYWICFLASMLGSVLAVAFVLLIAAGDLSLSIKIWMGGAVFGFGWGGRVFQSRMEEEMRR